MPLKEDILKIAIDRIEQLCDTKDDCLKLFKEELIALENENSLYLLSIEDNKPKEFHLSLASQEEFWNNALRNEAAMGINIEAYRLQVMNWNDTLPARDKRKKRTPRGWIATARQFMSSDKSKNRMIKMNDSKAIDYLNI